MCGFVQDSIDDFNWTRNQGSTPSLHTGPSADHTSGNGMKVYMYNSPTYMYFRILIGSHLWKKDTWATSVGSWARLNQTQNNIGLALSRI